MMARFRSLYGASPLHLLALIASLLVAGAAVVGWFDNSASPTGRILIWFLGAIIAHDLILLPLYSLLDRIAFGALRGRPPGPAPERVPGWVYLRVPALLSGLAFVVFFGEILRLGDETFHTASGLHQDVYLARYLFACGAMFAISALGYAVSLARARRARVVAQQSVDLRLGRDPDHVPEQVPGRPPAERGDEQERRRDGGS